MKNSEAIRTARVEMVTAAGKFEQAITAVERGHWREVMLSWRRRLRELKVRRNAPARALARTL